VQLVDRPHLNVGGALGGYQGVCIDTGMEAPLSGSTARVYIAQPHALEIARLAREAGWLDDVEMRQRSRILQLEEELAGARAKLSLVRDFVHIEAA
jgi:hypothetical protein